MRLCSCLSILAVARSRQPLLPYAISAARKNMSSRSDARSAGPEEKEAPAGPTYCLSCGRLMPHDTRADPTPRRYCSASCRGHAKDPALKPLRHTLSERFHSRLLAGSTRTVVLCSEVESEVFGNPIDEHGTQKVVGRPARPLQPAEQREEARRAARRLVAFGFLSQDVAEERSVEAVQDTKVVETSFAKGEWGIRWKA